MKKVLMITLLIVFCMAAMAEATQYTGYIESAANGGMTATGEWGNGNAYLGWTVNDTQYTGYWYYEYYFENGQKSISHAIIEVSDTFTQNDIISISTENTKATTLGTFNESNGNPGMPAGGTYGIKWDTENDPTSYTFWVVTSREPMWGDFYAKDGKDGGVEIYAYNTGFGLDTLAPIDNGNAMDAGKAWVLVPDTGSITLIPEPSTLFLLLIGFFGLGFISRRKLSALK